MGKLSLYWHTVKYLKPEQIIFRITKKLKMNCSLGVKVHIGTSYGPAALLPQLDFDPLFLARFPVEELLRDEVTLLHETECFCWNMPWRFESRSALWNYNLHYCEYLLPLVKTWQETKQNCYLDKLKQIVRGWICQNPKKAGGSGWDAYPISLRLIVWLSCYTYLHQDLDEAFKMEMLDSMAEQYAHLALHLEKHLLGNHYFENLKTLVICSLFFRDENMTEVALKELKKQCTEQILPDGMHFELSPMYHKIVLEDLLRVCASLRQCRRKDAELESYLQPMVNVAYSLEEGLDRIPLFNDCGNNVAKSLDALLLTAKDVFGIEPVYKAQLPDSGYYIFKNGDWKLIVDAGQPGPTYLPGHAHCDAMSFELFHKGKPILVNCGTYAYQCKERGFFRSTAAHNTVMQKDTEQSQYWGNFRMAKRARVTVADVSESSITMTMWDQQEGILHRHITLEEKRLHIRDFSEEHSLQAYLHFAPTNQMLTATSSHGTLQNMESMSYAPDFGRTEAVSTIRVEGTKKLEYWIPREE